MGGAPALPTPTTPGYTSFRGRTACVCLAKWLPVVERLGVLRGLIRDSLDIVQLTGNAAASAGVHRAGGVFDVKQRTDPWVALFREAGAPASWRRDTGEFANNQHLHGVLTGCPHNDPAAYQITAQRRGYNGLGQGAPGTRYAGQWGYGGKDPHPDPKTFRTWQQGLVWAQAEIARLEADMATPKEMWEYVLTSPLDPTYKTTAQSWLTNANVKAGEARALASRALAEVAALTAAFKALAAQPDLTPEQVTAAAKAGAQAALDEKITGAVTNLTVGP